MKPADVALASEKLRTALDLFVTGVAMKRAQLRRAQPDVCAEEIDKRLAAWLCDADGGEFMPVPLESGNAR